MNFNEEIDREFKAIGLKGKLIPIPEELRATLEDYAKLERKIAIKTQENEIMMQKSIEYAKNSIIS